MSKVLWISMCVPYDKVPHAGGKIENFYVKGLNKECIVEMITFANNSEVKDIDLHKYGINADIYVSPRFSLKKIFYAISTRMRLYNPCSNKMLLAPWQELYTKKNLIARKKSGNIPSVIVIEWTQHILLSEWIKKQFPSVPIVAIEEDVSFLSYERQYLNEKNFFLKQYKKKKYETLRKSELKQLKYADLVIVNNFKDYNLLIRNGLEEKQLWTWTPYFQSMLDLEYSGDSRDILFYGAMNRYENYASAIWFIKNVLPKLDGQKVRFVIVGGNPHHSLKKYVSDNVIITGFVDDIRPYFKHCLCLVAPLVLGAGVKIKIVESLTAGLPILTNNIGIEGIPAENGKSYFHCDSPDDYVRTINLLLHNSGLKRSISNNEKELAKRVYDYDISLKNFIRKIKKLINGKSVHEQSM